MVNVILLVTCFLISSPSWAADSYFPNVNVIDQSGRTARFYRDIVQGKTVVIHSFFGDCQGACPVLLGKMKQVQERLGDRLGSEVVLLSITVDSVNDTPERLAQTAASLGAKPGWYLISGTKVNVDWLLYKLGQYVEARETHLTNFLVGNEPSGKWGKLPVSASVDQIMNALERVSDGAVETAKTTSKGSL